MAEIRDRGSVLATEAGVQILKDAKGRKRNHNGKPWTYKDIEIEAGVSDKTIGRFFRREQPIDESIARSICQALEVEFQDVVEISHSSQAPFDPQEPELRWRETCRELLNQWKGLTTNVLTISNGVRFQLDEMFVPLGVVERRQKTRYHSDGGSPEQGSELYEERVTPISQNEFFEQVLRQGQSKNSQGKRVAIIGEPGAGKTTQLQKIGDWILKETDGIPIWIPLAELGTRSLEEYLLNRWLKTATSELKISQSDRDELEQLLKTGRVWLLLDAVDEMTIADALHQIAIQMNEGWLRNVRVVLTCRLNVWDAGKNALDRFDVYRNLDFDYPGEVHQFIDRWFATAPELQEKLKLALEKPGKERIRDMVKNPLRLTLLCHSWQLQQGELPETKAGLYEWFVDVFYEWNKGKVSVKLNSTQRNELNRALGELAKTAIDQQSSRFRLPEKLVRRFLGDADDESSLFSLALELGWLNRIGVAEESPLNSVYAFFHPTFQEYFAALAINNWQFFLNHVAYNPYEGNYRVFESEWYEVIVLWFGRKDLKSQQEEFIEAILDFQDGCEEFYYYRAYFIAALSTAEFSHQRTREISNQIAHWSFYTSEDTRHLWYESPLSKQARDLLYQIHTDEAAISLINLMQANPLSDLLEEEKRDLRAIALNYQNALELPYVQSNDGSRNLIHSKSSTEESLYKAIVLLARHDLLRCEIIEILIQLDPENPEIIKALTEIITNDMYKTITEKYFQRIRFSAVKLLAGLCPNDPKVLDALLELLSSNKEVILSFDIEELLRELAANDYELARDLVRLLHSSQTNYRHIPEIIEDVAFNHPQIAEDIIKLMDSCQDDDKKFVLGKTLGVVDPHHSNYISFVTDVLSSLEAIRCHKIIEQIRRNYYWKHKGIDEKIVAALIEFISNIETDLSVKPFSTTEELIDRSSQDYHNVELLQEACTNSIDLITEISPGSLDVSVLEKLTDVVHWDWFRILLAKALERISPGNQKAEQIFNRFLEKDSALRYDAAHALIFASPDHPKAVDTLVDLLCAEYVSDVIELFGNIYFSEADNPRLISTFQELLEHQDERIRSLAARSLCNLNSSQRQAVHTLIDLLKSPQQRVNALYSLDANLREGTLIFESKVAGIFFNNLIEFVNSDRDEYHLRRAVDIMISAFSKDLVMTAVRNLKENLQDSVRENNLARYQSCYRLIWHCAQNMGYPEFYQAWHDTPPTCDSNTLMQQP